LSLWTFASQTPPLSGSTLRSCSRRGNYASTAIEPSCHHPRNQFHSRIQRNSSRLRRRRTRRCKKRDQPNDRTKLRTNAATPNVAYPRQIVRPPHRQSHPDEMVHVRHRSFTRKKKKKKPPTFPRHRQNARRISKIQRRSTTRPTPITAQTTLKNASVNTDWIPLPRCRHQTIHGLVSRSRCSPTACGTPQQRSNNKLDSFVVNRAFANSKSAASREFQLAIAPERQRQRQRQAANDPAPPASPPKQNRRKEKGTRSATIQAKTQRPPHPQRASQPPGRPKLNPSRRRRGNRRSLRDHAQPTTPKPPNGEIL